jgi:hypothetical protein
MNSVLLILLLTAPFSSAQERQPRAARPAASMYRLTFTLHVIESGRDQTRNFMLVLEERSVGRVRSLRRIPARLDENQQYIETGIKCDAEFQEIAGGLRLEIEMHFSDAAAALETAGTPPIINEWQSHVEATVAPNEVTVLTTYDGGEGNRRYQFDVKAEKLR